MQPVSKSLAPRPAPRALSQMVVPSWTRPRARPDRRPAPAPVPQAVKPAYAAHFHGVCGGFL